MIRREFLQKAAAGLLLMSFGSGVYSIMHSANQQVQPEELPDTISRTEADMLSLAFRAPSGHNTQPWQIKVLEPGRWLLETVKERWLPAVDPLNREMYLSLGAFIANLKTAGRLYGQQVEVQLVAEDFFDTAVAFVQLYPVQPERDENILKEMQLRRTLRSGYLPHEITPEDVSYLTGGLPEIIYYSPASQEGRWLADGTIAANRQQVFHDDAQRELADWIRWSAKEAAVHRNGLTPESMELPMLARWYAKAFFDQTSVMQQSFRESTVAKVQEQVGCSGGWLIISSKDSTIASLLQAGEIFGELSLKARARQIALQPMMQILEEQPWKEQIAAQLSLTGNAQFIVRTGYVKGYPEPVSLRMGLSQIVY